MRSLSIAAALVCSCLSIVTANKYTQLLTSSNSVQNSVQNSEQNFEQDADSTNPDTDIKMKRSSGSKCETIYTSYCQNVGYNQTNMLLSPFSFMNQDEAGLELSQFYELLTSGCKRRTKDTMTLLMCSLYTPTCIEVSKLTKQ